MLVCSIQYLFPNSIVLFVMYSQNKKQATMSGLAAMIL